MPCQHSSTETWLLLPQTQSSYAGQRKHVAERAPVVMSQHHEHSLSPPDNTHLYYKLSHLYYKSLTPVLRALTPLLQALTPLLQALTPVLRALTPLLQALTPLLQDSTVYLCTSQAA